MDQTTTDLPRRATRDSTDYWVGGVASGLARHFGVPVLWVRVAFVASAALGVVGVAFYAGLWMTLPSDARFRDEAPGLASASRTGRRPGERRRLTDVGPVVAGGAVGVGVVLFAQTLFGAGVLFWPVLFGVIGVAVLWRQADEAQRERWLDTSGRINPVRAFIGPGTLATYARLAAGLGLLVVGISVFAVRSGDVTAARDVLLAAGLGIVGIVLTLGPWIFRLASDLSAERAERVRTQERADLAAHLHDSVLQTLALIQKNAGDAPTVARLARSQERDLRSWLYAGETVGDRTLASALRAMAAEVEDTHLVTVEVVAVGDVPLTEGLRPVVHAAREASTNAAKHAGTGHVDVYAEASPRAVDVFVRDRGAGFDQATIADDRMGVRKSIIDRMVRHGGSAEVRSSPGAGTEVRLHMPLEEETT